MTASELESYFQIKKEQIDTMLNELLGRVEAPQILKDAMLYSIRAGGKRIRPVLLLATMEAFDEDSRFGMPVACAIEMIHTYSLIHDDLPAMDDDDLRRGKPTNHKVFGEATAILAGDALLTLSFEVLGNITDERLPDSVKTALVSGLAKAAGAPGMVGGQTLDLQAEGKSLSLDGLEQIHRQKTGKLLAFSVEAGALLAGASASQIDALRRFSTHLGLVFQIRDDILDVEGDTMCMGKSVGSDENKEKSTYPKLLTISGAKQKLDDHLRLAKEALREVGIQHERLGAITDYIANRNH